MEEILASIRRIIADDQAMPPAEPAFSAEAKAAAHVMSPPDRSSREHAPDGPSAASGLAAYGQVTAPQFPSPDGPAIEDAAPDDDEESAVLPEAAVDGRRDADGHGIAAPGAPARRDDPNPPSQQDKRMRDQLARDAGQDNLSQDNSGQHLERDAAGRDDPADPAPRSSGLFSPATDHSLSSAFNMLAATRLADDSDELRAMAREMIRPLLKTWLDDNLPSLVERLVRAEIERVARGGR